MSGGWSRYMRGASSGRGTGCGSSAVAAVLAVAALLLVIHFLPDDGTVDQNMHGTASVDRSPQGGDRETGRHAKHKSAVGEAETPHLRSSPMKECNNG